MKKQFIGISYGRGGCKIPSNTGCELGPREIQKMYPNYDWTIIEPTWPFDFEKLQSDRFGENIKMQKIIYDACVNRDPNHIFIGGDHSVNFAHFKSIRDNLNNDDICLIYIDAHFDIHTPESSMAEASGSPHGTNVRQLLGFGDERYLSLGNSRAPLKSENLFFIGPRSYEPAELEFIKSQNIFTTDNSKINDQNYLNETIKHIREKIGDKKFVISFDFDAIDESEFDAVQVPEPNGLTLKNLEYLLNNLITENMISCELVEYAPLMSRDEKSKSTVQKIINKFL